MIRFEQVTKSYGAHRAVDGLSLTVAEGETMVLLGTSGCGKTTTLRMANRLIDPDEGDVFIGDRNVREQRPELLRRGIGYVLQHNSLFPHYTIAENMAVVPRLLGWTDAQILSRTDTLMAQLHLPPDVKGQYPAQLSGGQQQRVNVARALAADPPILLMDEPFGALDPVTRAAVRKEFTGLEALQRKTILMVTHDVEEAFELGDRICLMQGGKILQTGTPAQLLFQPAHPFVQAFLSGQALSLALRTVRLSQLLPLMGPDDQQQLNHPAADSTLWQLMEEDKGGNESAVLLAAFHRYRQQYN